MWLVIMKMLKFPIALRELLGGQELMESFIHTLEEGNHIISGFLKVVVEAKHTQLVKYKINISNMNEEEMEDITAIIALREIGKEVSMNHEQ